MLGAAGAELRARSGERVVRWRVAAGGGKANAARRGGLAGSPSMQVHCCNAIDRCKRAAALDQQVAKRLAHQERALHPNCFCAVFQAIKVLRSPRKLLHPASVALSRAWHGRLSGLTLSTTATMRELVDRTSVLPAIRGHLPGGAIPATSTPLPPAWIPAWMARPSCSVQRVTRMQACSFMQHAVHPIHS